MGGLEVDIYFTHSDLTHYMANKKSALKAIRQDKKRQARNAKIKENIKWLIGKAEKAIQSKSDQAKELIKQVEKAVDKAVQKDILKENTGRRKKSRLMIKFNKIFSGTKDKK